ncbi:Hypothetical protein NTJ_01904 [Nesidiocoris tenuis]|uniref:Uncharacterized protein n=1 Tax=Nesidiocoris tenuis TaxID=355587 RepID=A0ABN7A9V6_9HEMI|nr:Hypothetical protein NTJ_01904 [Nesidiocoris tenuis]
MEEKLEILSVIRSLLVQYRSVRYQYVPRANVDEKPHVNGNRVESAVDFVNGRQASQEIRRTRTNVTIPPRSDFQLRALTFATVRRKWAPAAAVIAGSASR